MAIELNRLQDMVYSIFQEFDRICQKYDIHYTMEGGTLLGSVKYGGFVPWDDDIDLMLPRPDYDRAVREYRHPDYIIDDILIHPDCHGKCGRISSKRCSLQRKTAAFWRQNNRRFAVFSGLRRS